MLFTSRKAITLESSMSTRRQFDRHSILEQRLEIADFRCIRADPILPVCLIVQQVNR